MIEGFDKEIDALLRQTATSETALKNNDSQSKIQNPKPKIHLDADEIAAFAENALPEKTKLKYTAHFADCDRCRTILANIITLNSEAETVPASSVVAPKIAETTAIPWYRKLFVVPNLAYAMGVLVVLFGGFFAFTVIRNSNDSQNTTQVSQMSESRPAASGPSFDSDETNFSAVNTMSNMSLNSAVSNSATMSNSSANYLSNKSVSSGGLTANANSAANTGGTKKESAQNENARVAVNNSAAGNPVARAADQTAESVAESKSVTSSLSADLPRQENEQPKTASPAPPSGVQNPAPDSRNADKLKLTREKKARSDAAENDSRAIGGKKFSRKDNVWYDSAYDGQNTTNIRRKSEDYRKLDSDLRSITDNLNGTIIVIWKGKTYRIQ